MIDPSQTRPKSGAPTITASVHSVGCSGLRTIAIRGFRLSSGEGADVSGFDLGPSPDEHLLGALGASLSQAFMNVACIQGLSVDRFDLDIEATADESGIAEVRSAVRIESDLPSDAFDGIEERVLASWSLMSWMTVPITIDVSVRPIDPRRRAGDDWVI